ncbi:MAG: DUF4274 domain-containing protein [Rhodobacterales bacterium]|nr:DUF4274 domain-containing protein [Rhodobacterales bacterium]
MNASDNRLVHLVLGGARALVELQCGGNELETLDLSACKSLCLLDCTANELRQLDCSNNSELAHLSCANNAIRTLDIATNIDLCVLSAVGTGGVTVNATDAQKHRLVELRVVYGLTSGSEEISRMNSWELHEYASNCAGRANETELLQIVHDPRCDLGTALMVYWMGAPHYYRQYQERDEVQPYERLGWDLLMAVQERIQSGFYVQANIWFDPRNDKQTRSVRGHDWTLDDRLVQLPAKWRIPREMTAPSLTR